MKSLVEEASTITKAIEKAWTRAGKPQSFSVKIFENPEVGFLGLTTKKSAKVGIFFEEVATDKAPRNHHNRATQTQDRGQERPHREHNARQDNREQRPERRPQDTRERGPRQNARPNNRPPQDREHSREHTRDTRAAHPRNRDQNSAHPRSQRDHGTPHNERQERHERPERHEQTHHHEAQQERVLVTPAPQNQAPVKPLDVTVPVTTAANIKRAPKISGRRFVAPKKDDESNRS